MESFIIKYPNSKKHILMIRICKLVAIYFCSYIAACSLAGDPVRSLISVSKSPDNKVELWIFETTYGATGPGPLYEICYKTNVNKSPVLLGGISEAVLSKGNSKGSPFGVNLKWKNDKALEVRYLKGHPVNFRSQFMNTENEIYAVNLVTDVSEPATWVGAMSNKLNAKERKMARKKGKTRCDVADT